MAVLVAVWILIYFLGKPLLRLRALGLGKYIHQFAVTLQNILKAYSKSSDSVKIILGQELKGSQEKKSLKIKLR